MPSSRTTALFLSPIVVLFVYGTVWMSHAITQQPTPPTAAARSKNGSLLPKRVFCFGDSLTAGTSPPERSLFPYAKHLSEALAKLPVHDEEPAPKVEWKGFPGWTSSSLLTDAGFEGLLDLTQKQRLEELKQVSGNGETLSSSSSIPPFDLVVILAGTNDLAYASESEPIFESIKGIHEAALKRGCQTIALGIPTSGWQSQSESARALAGAVNKQLAYWAEAGGSPKTTFVPFPIQSFDRSSGLWSPDGLHFSPSGYELVGKSLAPIVANILWKGGT